MAAAIVAAVAVVVAVVLVVEVVVFMVIRSSRSLIHLSRHEQFVRDRSEWAGDGSFSLDLPCFGTQSLVYHREVPHDQEDGNCSRKGVGRSWLTTIDT